MAEHLPVTVVEEEKNYKLKCREIKFEISFKPNSEKYFKTPFFYLDSEIKCSFEFYAEINLDDDEDDDDDKEEFDIKLSLLSLVFEKNVDFNSLFLFVSLNELNHQTRDFHFIELKKDDDNPKEFSSRSEEIKIRKFPAYEIDFRLKIFYSLVQYKPELSWKSALKNEFTDNKICDFTITLSDGDIINVNKLVLYYSSPVFEEAIESDMLESKTNNMNISNFEPTVVKEFIKYIYTRKCEISDHVHELFKIADMYEIEHLKKECEDYLLNNIYIRDALETLKLADNDLYNLNHEVKEKIEDFIHEHESELIHDKEFVKYYLSKISIENVGDMFKMAMSYDNNELLIKVQEFIKRNLEKCMKNDKFTKLVKENPDWSIRLWKFISQFKMINDD